MFYATSLVVVPTLWPERRYFLLLLVLFVFYAMHLLFYYVEEYYFVSWLYATIDHQPVPLESFLRRFTWWYCYFGLAMMIFAYYRLVIEELNEKNVIEKELAQVQSKFLRSQFNPHFLFNVLNYMYDKASHTSEELSDSILLLADTMRYSLQTENPLAFANLSDEVKQLENYIHLSKLRFERDVFVNIDVEGDISRREILPRVLMSLTENAFQYSDINDPNFPLQLQVHVETDCINVLITSQTKPHTSDLSQRSHYQPIINRLDAAYSGAYTLNIDDQSDTYICELTIHG